MFMQLIQGKVADQARLQELMDRWRRDLEPGANNRLKVCALAVGFGVSMDW
jgi:hypothetical protein